MSKYENALKYVQLRKYVEEKKYDKALELAENMDEEKVRDVSELKLIADVYRKNERFEKSKELYYEVYNEINTRRILYTLIMLCVKSNSIQEAESLYQEYLTKDKKSADRFILRYRIDKASGADRNVVIADLETIVHEDYIEEWAYELARQYHKAGMVRECVDECSNIILWFSDGETVEKAKLLKMHYENNVGEDIMSELQSSIGTDIGQYIDEVQQVQDEQVQDEQVRAEQVRADEDLVFEERRLSEDEMVSAEQARLAAIEADLAAVRLEAERNASKNFRKGIFSRFFSHSDSETLIKNAADEASGLKKSLNMKDETVLKQDTPEDFMPETEDNGDEKPEDYMPETEDNGDEMPEDYAPEVSKYGSDIPYMHIKELFRHLNEDINRPINFAIAVSEPSYAVALVRKIAKELQNKGLVSNSKIAKISASKLNTLRLDEQIQGLLGSCVMIENASEMNGQTINSLIKIVDAYPDRIVLMLVDEEENLSRMLFREEVLKNQIKLFITSLS